MLATQHITYRQMHHSGAERYHRLCRRRGLGISSFCRKAGVLSERMRDCRSASVTAEGDIIFRISSLSFEALSQDQSVSTPQMGFFSDSVKCVTTKSFQEDFVTMCQDMDLDFHQKQN